LRCHQAPIGSNSASHTKSEQNGIKSNDKKLHVPKNEDRRGIVASNEDRRGIVASFLGGKTPLRRGLSAFNALAAIVRNWGRQGAGLLPKTPGDLQCIDLEIFPPDRLIAGLMQLPMMTAAEWDGEFVANFEAEGSRLSKPQVMRIGRLPSADEAGLRGHES